MTDEYLSIKEGKEINQTMVPVSVPLSQVKEDNPHFTGQVYYGDIVEINLSSLPMYTYY